MLKKLILASALAAISLSSIGVAMADEPVNFHANKRRHLLARHHVLVRHHFEHRNY